MYVYEQIFTNNLLKGKKSNFFFNDNYAWGVNNLTIFPEVGYFHFKPARGAHKL